MNTDTFREYSTRLNLLYTRYLQTVRDAFFPTAPRAARARAERPEQRREDDGGSLK